MEIQECSPPEYNLVFDWAEKWFDLIELINNVTGTDDVLDPVSPPTESDELQYQSLRSWHFKHETQFVPLWEVFYKSHDWSIDRSNVDEDFDFPQKYLQNPFLFFYEPETLYK